MNAIGLRALSTRDRIDAALARRKAIARVGKDGPARAYARVKPSVFPDATPCVAPHQRTPTAARFPLLGARALSSVQREKLRSRVGRSATYDAFQRLFEECSRVVPGEIGSGFERIR